MSHKCTCFASREEKHNNRIAAEEIAASGLTKEQASSLSQTVAMALGERIKARQRKERLH